MNEKKVISKEEYKKARKVFLIAPVLFLIIGVIGSQIPVSKAIKDQIERKKIIEQIENSPELKFPEEIKEEINTLNEEISILRKEQNKILKEEGESEEYYNKDNEIKSKETSITNLENEITKIENEIDNNDNISFNYLVGFITFAIFTIFAIIIYFTKKHKFLLRYTISNIDESTKEPQVKKVSLHTYRKEKRKTIIVSLIIILIGLTLGKQQISIGLNEKELRDIEITQIENSEDMSIAEELQKEIEDLESEINTLKSQQETIISIEGYSDQYYQNNNKIKDLEKELSDKKDKLIKNTKDKQDIKIIHNNGYYINYIYGIIYISIFVFFGIYLYFKNNKRIKKEFIISEDNTISPIDEQSQVNSSNTNISNTPLNNIQNNETISSNQNISSNLENINNTNNINNNSNT